MFRSATTSWELDHGAPIGPQLHRILRERIVRNDLVSGSAISEPEIAKIYSISRQPVREAFIKLSEEGLISIQPKRRTIVKKIDPISVLEAQFVREAVEADIIKLLAQSSDPAVVEELRAQMVHQQCAADTNPHHFIVLDERFHQTLAQAAGKTSAWQFIEGIKSQMDRVRVLSIHQFPAHRLLKQHHEIIDSIEMGDVRVAEKRIRAHLKEIVTDLPEIQTAHPEFFSDPEKPMEQHPPHLP